MDELHCARQAVRRDSRRQLHGSHLQSFLRFHAGKHSMHSVTSTSTRCRDPHPAVIAVKLCSTQMWPMMPGNSCSRNSNSQSVNLIDSSVAISCGSYLGRQILCINNLNTRRISKLIAQQPSFTKVILPSCLTSVSMILARVQVTSQSHSF